MWKNPVVVAAKCQIMGGKKSGSSSPRNGARSSRSPPGAVNSHKRKETTQDHTRTYAFIALGIIVVGVAAQYLYHNYVVLPGRISTKSDLMKVGVPLDPKVWGTYRSHIYFGLRTGHPQSPLFGMIWYEQPVEQMVAPSLRHTCEKDEVNEYAWTEADGRSFGRQIIRDRELKLNTDWLRDGHTWTARITASCVPPVPWALIFYFALQDDESRLQPLYKNDDLQSFEGVSAIFGNFSLSVRSKAEASSRSFLSLKMEPFVDITKIKELLMSTTMIDRERNILRLPSGYLENGFEPHPNLIAMQLNFLSNTTVEISYSVDGKIAVKGKKFDEILSQRTGEFDAKFEEVYGLTAKGYSWFHQRMGKVALSNMLGSIGYAYGWNRVQSQYSSKVSLYGPHELFSSCPSRSVFPRGFLWDEGFHHLLFRKFDPELSLQVISSWLDTMNADGWIPREMILGAESEMRVPEEFVVQRDTVANPPMFFYLIERFLDDTKFLSSHSAQLIALYPRLRLWHKWLNTTQSGPLPGTYRWHGRNATTDLELNPKTLPSGLDDFPRASHPSQDEYHLDLRCWMAVSARVLARLAKIAGDSERAAVYAADAQYLSDIENLNRLHWSEKTKRYCDFGLHSTAVALQRTVVNSQKVNPNMPPPPKKRVTKRDPQLGLVENVPGYVSLFPLILHLLPPDSDKLGIVFESLKAEKGLWSEYGLRSIAPTSPYYKAYNTEHDPPYWRGAVWINVNYLVISALKHYSSVSGPYQELAFSIYSDLRKIVVTNMAREFKRTGTLWESYEDGNGRGRGAHPFTGWSSLVLSIMAEQFD